MLQSIILIDPRASLTAKPSSNTFVVSRAEDQTVISIEQIRQLISWVGQYGFEPGHKTAVILQAELWHPTAPEALLKTLEEPPAETTIILTTPHPASLPATIRSRCATVTIGDIPPSQLTCWGLSLMDQPDPPPVNWQQFSQMPQFDKWLTIEPWLKSKKDMSIIVRAWQQQSREIGTTAETVRQQAALSQAQLDLRANVLPRLAIDRLLLQLD